MPFKDLDIFPKVCEDHSRKTTFSGVVTVICLIIMSYLVVSQTIGYIATPPRQRLSVDQRPLPTYENGTLDWDSITRVNIHVDIEFPNLPCPVIDFQVLDAFKDRQLNSFAKMKLRRLDKNGNKIKSKKNTTNKETCGSCYGMKSGCCNTCKDVKNAFKAKGRLPPPLSTIKQCRDDVISYQNIKDEKCRMYGTITVPSTRSTLVISTGDSVDDTTNSSAALGIGMDHFNMTHKINSLYVENERGDSPLNGIVKVQEKVGIYKGIYYLRTLRQKEKSSYVYRITATHYDRYRDATTGKFPGLYFNFDIAPIIVEYKKDRSILHFLVDLMAIIGGIYSLGSLLDHISLITIKKMATQIE